MLKEQEQIKQQVETIISAAGHYLVDLRIGSVGKHPFIKILIANEKNDITLAEVTTVTRNLRDDIILNEILPDDYRLEVGSPGIDYPLKDRRDFYRNIGRELKVYHHSPQLQSPFNGLLIGVTEDGLQFSAEEQERYLPFSDLDYAKVVIKWK